jgi:hypothetical protein
VVDIIVESLVLGLNKRVIFRGILVLELCVGVWDLGSAVFGALEDVDGGASRGGWVVHL